MPRRWMIVLITLAALSAPLSAAAQDPEYVPDAKDLMKGPEQKEAAVDGWKTTLELGFNASIADSNGVVGATDGTTVQLGLALKGAADLVAGPHEWLNSLTYNVTQTRTPSVPVFVKSADEAALRSVYLYSIPSVPWLGPFARFRLNTQLFRGDLVRADRVRLVGAPAADAYQDPIDGEPWTFKLTSPFEPLVLRESLGAFARPLKSDALSITFSVGAGAQQVRTQGGYAVKDDPETSAVTADDPETPQNDVVADTIELSPLVDSTQLGAEVELELGGKLSEQVTYGATANLLHPFYSDPEKVVDGETLEGFDLANIDLSAKVSFKLARWASVDYVLTAKRQPLVVAGWQVQNNLLLNAAFNLL